MAWEVTKRGDLTQFPIVSAKFIDSLEKWVINEKFWALKGPEENSRFITVQRVTITNGEESREEWNVISYASAEAVKTEKDYEERILAAPDAGKAQALAMFFSSRR